MNLTVTQATFPSLELQASPKEEELFWPDLGTLEKNRNERSGRSGLEH